MEDDRIDIEVDSRARTKHGRRNSYSLPQTEIAQLLEWKSRVLQIDFPTLGLFLHSHPMKDAIIEIVVSFAALTPDEARGLYAMKSGYPTTSNSLGYGRSAFRIIK